MQLRMGSNLTSSGKVISVSTRVQSYGMDTARVSVEVKGQLCEPLLSSQCFGLCSSETDSVGQAGLCLPGALLPALLPSLMWVPEIELTNPVMHLAVSPFKLIAD